MQRACQPTWGFFSYVVCSSVQERSTAGAQHCRSSFCAGERSVCSCRRTYRRTGCWADGGCGGQHRVWSMGIRAVVTRLRCRRERVQEPVHDRTGERRRRHFPQRSTITALSVESRANGCRARTSMVSQARCCSMSRSCSEAGARLLQRKRTHGRHLHKGRLSGTGNRPQLQAAETAAWRRKRMRARLADGGPLICWRDVGERLREAGLIACIRRGSVI